MVQVAVQFVDGGAVAVATRVFGIERQFRVQVSYGASVVAFATVSGASMAVPVCKAAWPGQGR